MKLLLQALLAVAAVLAAGGARLALAQESAGGYTTRVGGQTFGTESYKIATNADGSRRAEADAAFGGTKLKVLTTVGAAELAWFREHAGHDLLSTARRVRVPALVANGERDALVMPHHALALAQALSGAGNKRVTLRIFRDLTHLFTPASGGVRAGVVSEEFLSALQEWASGVLAKK